MKKFLSVIFVLVVLCLTVATGTIHASAISASEIKSQLDQIRINEHPPGSAGMDCYAFVKKLSNRLFGHDLATQASNKYQFTSSYTTNFTQVGTTLVYSNGTLTETTLKNLFLQSQAGDVVQMNYTTWNGKNSFHTMMVYSASQTGIILYHAGKSSIYFGVKTSGSDKLNGTSGKEMKWSEFIKFLSSAGDGVSIYRSKKANSSHTHSYSAATCTSPKKCTICGATSGSALSHTYSNSCDKSCNRCGATRTVSEHVWSNKYCGSGYCLNCNLERVTFHYYYDATCTIPKICKWCGLTNGSALGHTYSNSCDTTCNRCGITRNISHSFTNSCDTSCNTCGAARAITHKYNSGVVTTTPSCKSHGTKTYTCTVCSATKMEILKMTNDHKYGNWILSRAATCTEKGQLIRSCTVCNKTQNMDAEPTGHNFGDWKTVKQPTTESVGEAQRSCKNKNCSAKESKTVSKLSKDGHAHKFGKWKTVIASTCVTNGKKERECSICGATETTIPAYSEHIFTEWETSLEPTENSVGEKKRKCANCSKIEIAIIEKLPQTVLNENLTTDEKQPMQYQSNKHRSNKGKSLVIIISSLAIATLGGTGAFIFLKKKFSK